MPKPMKDNKNFINLDGQRFGKLVVLKSDATKKGALVRCDCGTEFITARSGLRAKNRPPTSSCGKGICRSSSSNLTGKRFGSLVVVKILPDRRGVGKCIFWECLCDCGNTYEVAGASLIKNRANNCGCQTSILQSKSGTLPDNMGHINAILAQYKAGATKRNLQFLLEDKDFIILIQSDCHYCGAGLSNTRKAKKRSLITGPLNPTFRYNGIDRKDSTLNYTLDNCVSACAECNYAKGKRSYDEFIAHAKRIANRFT